MKRTILFGLLAAGWGCASETPVQPLAETTPAIQASQAAPEYEMIDLGTLGGDRVRPLAFNEAGQVVGYGSIAGDPFGRHAFLWENGAMRDLATGRERSEAQVITAAGVIFGSVETYGGPGGDCVGLKLFKWESGVRTNVGDSFCDNNLFAVGVTVHGGILAVEAMPQGSRSSIWLDGVRQSLGSLGRADRASARAMNKHDQIVGSSTVGFITSNSIDHPFIWEDGVMRDLGVLSDPPCDDDPGKNCGEGDAFDINKHGIVVGTSNSHAVVWTGGGITDLGGGEWFDPSLTADINDQGEAVGNIGAEAFIWTAGTLTRLPSLGGRSGAVAINEKGLIAGFSTTATGEYHAVVWHDGAMVDLGHGPGAAAAAVAINENGDVIGVSGPCVSRAEGGCYFVGEPTRAILWRRLLPQEVVAQQ